MPTNTQAHTCDRRVFLCVPWSIIFTGGRMQRGEFGGGSSICSEENTTSCAVSCACVALTHLVNPFRTSLPPPPPPPPHRRCSRNAQHCRCDQIQMPIYNVRCGCPQRMLQLAEQVRSYFSLPTPARSECSFIFINITIHARHLHVSLVSGGSAGVRACPRSIYSRT